MDKKFRKLQRRGVLGDTSVIPQLIAGLKQQGYPPIFNVHNVRFGFATNSSSSHSIILAEGLNDDLAAIDGAMSYGWGNFTLASRVAKAQYIATAMVNHYRRKYKMGRTETSAIVRKFFGIELSQVSDEDLWESYIDHSSIPCFPTPRDEEGGMEPFWKLLKKYIVEKSNVVILGGNDNSDGHPLSGMGPISSIYEKAIAIEDDSDRTFIHDTTTGHFTIFSPCGTRVRFTPPDVPIPTSSTVPELIDLKITDYCEMNCNYCYMDSSKEGAHAQIRDLESLSYILGSKGVFEVAIGGGEPTEHPDFVRILKAFHRQGVVPNFSTQSWRWLEKPEIWEAVARYCGAVALSTQNPEHIEPWLTACNEKGINPHFHYVLGLNPLENLEHFLDTVSSRNREKTGYGNPQIVLLAHKAIGRAAGVSPHPYDGWAEIVSEKSTWGMTIAIDSFLVKDIEEGIFTGNRYIDPILYESSDGKFSMYYDAVNKTAAAHSFIPQAEQIPVANLYRIMDTWDKIRENAT